ncbi:MAG TPA: cation transporter [Leptospiraceae bacterium]|nr:cation transporter [Spirochaetaceae bacterium]HBS07070.1 cation transporter [Leptospiraceae bacterium]
MEGNASSHHHHSGHGSHSHDHEIKDTTSFRLWLGIILNVLFAGAEAFAGFWTDSLALLADAGHNFSDVMGLVLALIAVHLGRQAATDRFTYGKGRASIQISLLNSVILLGAAGAIAMEAIDRLREPAQVPGMTIVYIAAIGVLINGISTALYWQDRKDDLNMRGAFLHMAADALVSLSVVVGGLAMQWTGAFWIDPALSIIVAGVIVWSTVQLLWNALKLSLDAVPDDIDTSRVREYLQELPGVQDVHDLHIWAMSTRKSALSAHLVVDSLQRSPELLSGIKSDVEGRFGISHPTIQIEEKKENCPDC